MAAPEQVNSSTCCLVRAEQSASRIWQSVTASRTSLHRSSPDQLPASSIPRTSPERLAQASPDYHGPRTATTVLYLAYGSNLSAHTFLGVRGIKPISSINVSAPGLDLTFDLPGLPYSEPCFANTALRKIPKLPLPGDPPIKPPIDLPPHAENICTNDKSGGVEAGLGGGGPDVSFPALPIRRPTWSKGLYGVVYEVTAADYRKIIATEGGGTSYAEIATLCVALPPAIRVPEQPPTIPDTKPFLAKTLYAPRLPNNAEPPVDDDKKWWRKFLLPVRRAEADYAQPSLRYLRLIREGAAEHFLPFEYQQYLQRLEHYTITRRKQEIGRLLFSLLFLPLLLLLVLVGKFVSDKDGKHPRWLAVVMGVHFNVMWMSYDAFFKDTFGDGERTMEDEEDDENDVTRSMSRRSWWHTSNGATGEKNRLLNDW
ncbi:hypothetical protein PFICI_00845 [Pestalotiopsis fici W106-1]|uniref:gamma-glutamylcyclotransferase n=1 Tax=Pestalotiopsis fici (strain W106-1 / CGMCC3.15140) TaxID=1229662 RepID=W3XNB9_PESFW|nr:uncharacterized protein PFICI_00845 [Pestalotiopsis fici W106-1]ETS87017.1 hypothetical protein PFICI_00845 [Pestalotiopsis fici W106-1]